MHPLRISFAQFLVLVMLIGLASPAYAGWFGTGTGGIWDALACLNAVDKEACYAQQKAASEEDKKKQEEAKNAPALKEYGFKIGNVEFKDVPEGIAGFEVFCVVYGSDQAPTDGTAAYNEMKQLTGYGPQGSQTVYSVVSTKNFGGYFIDNPVRRLKSSAHVDELIAFNAVNTYLSAKTWGCGLMLSEKYSKNQQTQESYYSTTNPGGDVAPIGGTSKVWVTGKMPVSLNPAKGGEINLNDTQKNNIEVPKGQKLP